MIHEAVYTILSGASAVTDIVGTNISHLTMNQESQMPYITYMVLTNDGNPTKDTLSEIDEVYLAVYCVSMNNVESANIAAAVRNALDGVHQFHRGY